MNAPSPAIRHTLGFKGNYRINRTQQGTARDYNLRVQHLGGDQYVIEPQDARFNLDQFSPASIARDGNVYSRDSLKQFLDFLHQPVRASVDNRRTDVLFQSHLSKDDRQQQAHDARTDIHQILRFMTTGSTEIPGAPTEDGKPAEPGCHADAEAYLKEMDSWRSETEIGNRQDVFTATPDSGFDPAKGFYFRLHPQFLNPGDENANRTALKAHVEGLLSGTKESPLLDDPTLIYMSATELEEFCHAALAHPETSALLQEAHMEHLLEQAERDVAQRIGQLTGQPPATLDGIQRILKSTSALTPLVKSDLMGRIWSTFHWTQRHRSPFAQISEDFTVFETLANRELGNFDPVRASALLLRFSSLMNFSRLLAGELGLKEAEKALADHGGLPIAEKFLDPRHKAALEAVRDALEQGSSPAMQLLEGSSNSLKTVVVEGASYSAGTKNRLRVITALTALYMTLVLNPSLLQKASNAAGVPEKQKTEISYVYNDQGVLEEIPVPVQAKKETPATTQGIETIVDGKPAMCHPHILGVTIIQHCFFNERVKDFTRGTLETIETTYDNPAYALKLAPYKTHQDQAPFSLFSQNARVALNATANFWLYLNVLQFIAHAPFFSMMAARGYKQRMEAYKNTGSLFAEFADSFHVLGKHRPLALPLSALGAGLAYSQGFGVSGTIISAIASGSIGNKLWQKSTGLKKDILGIVSDIEPGIVLANESDLALMDEFARAAFYTRIAGIKQRFNLTAENYAPALNALQGFGSDLTTIAPDIGIQDDWYQDLLAQKTAQAIEAFQKYERDGDQRALQRVLNKNLSAVMGAEARHKGESSIYNAIFADAAHKDADKLLKRQGDKYWGSELRWQIMRDHYERIVKTGQNLEENIKSGVVIGSVGIAQAFVRSLREVQAGYERIPHKNVVLPAAGALATGVVALDLSGQSVNMLGPYVGEVARQASGLLGYAFGGAVTTVAFGTYNIWDDTVLTDTGYGTAFQTQGVIAGGAVEHGVIPTFNYGRELYDSTSELLPKRVI